MARRINCGSLSVLGGCVRVDDGPEAVPAYLSRYTHRVAISNRRLISLDETGVTFRTKDCRREGARIRTK